MASSMPTINIMEFNGEVATTTCYTSSEGSVTIPEYQVHLKNQPEQFANCLICKRSVNLNSEGIVDINQTFTTTTKIALAESINRLVLPNSDKLVSFANSGVCLQCYASLDRADSLFHEFTEIQSFVKEKMSEIIEIMSEPSNEQINEQGCSSESLPVKKSERYASIEIYVSSHSMLPLREAKEYTCYFCFKMFTRKASLAEHFDNVHSKFALIECRICENDLPGGLTDFMSHVSRKHSMIDIKEALGDLKVKDPSLIRPPTMAVEQLRKRRVNCLDCQVTLSESLLEEHLLSYHTKKKAKEKHIPQIKSPTIVYNCIYCTKQFNKQERFTAHLERVHGNTNDESKQFQCQKCPKKFHKIAQMKRHQQCIHENIKQFTCNICRTSFKTKSLLSTHMVKHSEMKPYVCQICSSSYYTYEECTDHVNKIHNIECVAEYPETSTDYT